MQHTEQKIIEHCAQLLWGFNWAQSNIHDDSVETFSDDEDIYYMTKGLTDEDKFLCALFSQFEFEYLTSRTLMLLYGWTRYKARKVRKALPFIKTSTGFCEDACGYCGKIWTLDYKFKKAMQELKKLNKPCCSCTILIKSPYGDWHKCPISKSFRSNPDDHCDQIKLEITEQFNNFWK